MARSKICDHDWKKTHHRKVCRRCGKTVPCETCRRPVKLTEPAGTRSLLCGHFHLRQTRSAKRLWDQFRLSRAFQPFGEEFVSQPYPPRWFITEHLGRK